MGMSMEELLEISARLLRDDGQIINPWQVLHVIPPLGGDESGGGPGWPVTISKGWLRGSDDRVQRNFWIRVARRLVIPRLMRTYLNRLEDAVRAIARTNGLSYEIKRYRTRKKLLVGIGGASAWESGVLSLNPFGIPWIPGSSLKGAMRWTAIIELLERIESSGLEGEPLERLLALVGLKRISESQDGSECVWRIEEHDLGSIRDCLDYLKERGVKEEILNELTTLIKLFGSKKEAGRLIIIGGFPEPSNQNFLTPEVVNPHYRSYYQGSEGDSEGRPPGDWEDPIPFFHAVVREGVTFRFYILCPLEFLDRARKLLRRTLVESGIGGRKSSGYGLFEEVV